MSSHDEQHSPSLRRTPALSDLRDLNARIEFGLESGYGRLASDSGSQGECGLLGERVLCSLSCDCLENLSVASSSDEESGEGLNTHNPLCLLASSIDPV